VILVGALGMFTGDSIALMLGHSSAGRIGRGWLNGRLCTLRRKIGPTEEKTESKTKRAAERFTRGLRRPGPLVLLLCRFVPGGRMAAGFHAGRTGYPVKKFILYDGLAALAWSTYGGLVGHVGGTAITQSAWRLFAIAASAAIVFGTAGWILALFGGRKEAAAQAANKADAKAAEARKADVNAELTAIRAASADAPLPRSTPTMTGR